MPIILVAMNRENDTERGRAERAIRRQNEYSATLHETALALMHRLELADLLKAIVARAGALMGTPHGYVYLLEPGETEIEMRVGVGIYDEYVGYRLSPGEGLAGKVWESGQSLVVEDYAAWEGRSAKFVRDDFRAVVGVPLKSGSEVVGVIGLAYLEENRTFGDDELELLTRFAELASIALDNARLYASAQQELIERERAEQALRGSEEQYRMLVETVQEGIGFVDAEERITYCNRAYAEIFELTPEELTGRSLFEFLDDEQRQKALEQTALRKTGVQSSYEIVIETEGGARKLISASGAPIVDENGRFWGAVHAIIDVTERRRAEEALQASEERLRRLVEQAADALFVHDLQGRFVNVNRQACESLGYTREELLNLSVADVEVKFTPEGLSELWERIVAGDPLTLEGIHRRKDGTRFPVEVRVGPFETRQDRLMLAMARDVTERKRAEEALKKSEAHNRSVLETAPDAILTMTTDGIVRSFNPGAERIFGYASEEAVGRALKMLMPERFREPHEKGLRRYLKTGEAHVIGKKMVELAGLRKSGEEFPLELSLGEMREEGERVFVGVIRDVTERKRAEEALRESEERFRRLFEYSVDTQIVHDEEGRILDCNSEACRTLGYTHEELLSLRIQDIADGLLSEGEKREREKQGGTLWQRAVRGEPDTFGIVHHGGHKRKDGTTFPIEVHVGGVDYGGRRAILASVRDISERKEAERRLEESEQRYKSLFEHNPDAVYSFDLEGNFLTANAACAEISGYTVEELLRMSFTPLIVPEDLETVLQHFEEAARGEPQTYETAITHKEGHRVELNVTNLPIIVSDEIVGVYGIAKDITERKRAEEFRSRLATIVESSEDAIISRTLDGTIISWNRGAEDLYGYTAEEVIGRSNAFLYPPEHPHEMQEIQERVRRGESIDHYETVRMAKGGRRVHVSLTVSPTIDAAGNVTGDSGIARDITERKRIEEDLRKAQEHFRTVFEEAAIGLCTADPRSWTLLETNEAYQKMLGYTEEELRGKNISDISHPADARHDPEFAAKILSGEVKRYER